MKGLTLKELRTNAGLTREQVAKKSFVDVSCITHWELGDWAPSKKYYKKLAKLYGVSEAEIMDIAAEIRAANAEGA